MMGTEATGGPSARGPTASPQDSRQLPLSGGVRTRGRGPEAGMTGRDSRQAVARGTSDTEVGGPPYTASRGKPTGSEEQRRQLEEARAAQAGPKIPSPPELRAIQLLNEQVAYAKPANKKPGNLQLTVRTRPGYGTKGRKLRVKTNWYLLDVKNLTKCEDGSQVLLLHRYRLGFIYCTLEQYHQGNLSRNAVLRPEHEKERFEILRQMLAAKPDVWPSSHDMAFDGEFLVARRPLNFSGQITVLDIKNMEIGGRRKDVCLEVLKQSDCFFSPSAVQRDMTPPTAAELDRYRDPALTNDSISGLACLNAVVRMYRRMPLTDFARDFLTVNRRDIYRVPTIDQFGRDKNLDRYFLTSPGLIHLQGLFSMVKVAGESNRLMLNADVCNGVFRRPLWLLELMCMLLNAAAGGRPVYSVGQLRADTQLTEHHVQALEPTLIKMDLSSLEDAPFPERGYNQKLRNYGRPGKLSTRQDPSFLFGEPPRDRYFAREVPKDIPDAIPVLRQTPPNGRNGNGVDGNGINGNGGGRHTTGRTADVDWFSILPPPRAGFRWQIISVYDYYTQPVKDIKYPEGSNKSVNIGGKGRPLTLVSMPTVLFRNTQMERKIRKGAQGGRDEGRRAVENIADYAYAIPLEYLVVTYPQKHRGNEPEIVAEIIKNAAMPATERQKKIDELIRQADMPGDPWLHAFSISANCQMLDCDARVLEPPNITIANRPQPIRDGVWKCSGRLEVSGPPIQHWAVIAFQDNDKRLQQELGKFPSAFAGDMNQRGMRFNPNPVFTNYYTKNDQREVFQRLESALRTAGAQINASTGHPTIGLLVVILPAKNLDLYSEIKYMAEIEYGWMTQCLLKQTVMNKWKPMTIDNIALKVNVKTGGTNWKIRSPDPLVQNLLFGSNTMVIGMDVTHPVVGESAPSVAAICWSVSSDLMNYSAFVRPQKKNRENVVYLRDCAQEMFRDVIHRKHGRPERIIVYRDGVAEGQFNAVANEEVMALKAALMNSLGVKQADLPRITFIIAKKRHHTRFFPQDPKAGVGKGMNVPPGLVLDRSILHKDDFDFFLMGHLGIQGTCRPIHYSVIHDDNDLAADTVQMMTLTLSYMYARCPRAVHCPAPVYYADLIAARAAVHLRNRIGRDTETSTGSVKDEEETMAESEEQTEAEGSASATLSASAGLPLAAWKSSLDQRALELCQVKSPVRDLMYWM